MGRPNMEFALPRWNGPFGESGKEKKGDYIKEKKEQNNEKILNQLPTARIDCVGIDRSGEKMRGRGSRKGHKTDSEEYKRKLLNKMAALSWQGAELPHVYDVTETSSLLWLLGVFGPLEGEGAVLRNIFGEKGGGKPIRAEHISRRSTWGFGSP